MIVIIGVGEWHNLLRLYGSKVRPIKDNCKLSFIRERQRHGFIGRFGKCKQVLDRQPRYPTCLAIAREYDRMPMSEWLPLHLKPGSSNQGQVFILDVSDNWG